MSGKRNFTLKSYYKDNFKKVFFELYVGKQSDLCYKSPIKKISLETNNADEGKLRILLLKKNRMDKFVFNRSFNLKRNLDEAYINLVCSFLFVEEKFSVKDNKIDNGSCKTNDFIVVFMGVMCDPKSCFGKLNSLKLKLKSFCLIYNNGKFFKEKFQINYFPVECELTFKSIDHINALRRDKFDIIKSNDDKYFWIYFKNYSNNIKKKFLLKFLLVILEVKEKLKKQKEKILELENRMARFKENFKDTKDSKDYFKRKNYYDKLNCEKKQLQKRFNKKNNEISRIENLIIYSLKDEDKRNNSKDISTILSNEEIKKKFESMWMEDKLSPIFEGEDKNQIKTVDLSDVDSKFRLKEILNKCGNLRILLEDLTGLEELILKNSISDMKKNEYFLNVFHFNDQRYSKIKMLDLSENKFLLKNKDPWNSKGIGDFLESKNLEKFTNLEDFRFFLPERRSNMIRNKFCSFILRGKSKIDKSLEKKIKEKTFPCSKEWDGKYADYNQFESYRATIINQIHKKLSGKLNLKLNDEYISILGCKVLEYNNSNCERKWITNHILLKSKCLLTLSASVAINIEDEHAICYVEFTENGKRDVIKFEFVPKNVGENINKILWVSYFLEVEGKVKFAIHQKKGSDPDEKKQNLKISNCS